VKEYPTEDSKKPPRELSSQMKTTDTLPRQSATRSTPIQATPKSPEKSRGREASQVEQVDSLFTTLRTRKISMSACHAIVKLYMASGSNRERLLLSTLAGKIGITNAAITSVVDSMESHGFAVRQRDTTDRRSVVISLTPEGKHFAESLGASVQS
jgi:DNA-binding MarR family transcriptional regulator